MGVDALNDYFIQGSWCALERFSKMSMFFSSPYLLCVVRSAILLLSGSSFTLISRNPSDLIMRAHHLFDNNVPLSLDMLSSIAAFAQSEIHGCVVGQAFEETQITTPTMHQNLVQIKTTQFLLSKSGNIIKFRFRPLFSSSSNQIPIQQRMGTHR